MEHLHEDIISKILSHVTPLESVLNCKLVCKQWRKVLGHTKMGTKMGLLLSIATYSDLEGRAQLYYADSDDISSCDPYKFCYSTDTTKINHPPLEVGRDVKVIVGSCNGLVCFAITHGMFGPYGDPVHIFNPVTREYVDLPRFEQARGDIVSGFGYLHSTKEYKVVRIWYPDRIYNSDATIVGWVQVYTIGKSNSSGYWRNLTTISESLYLSGIFLNGSLHWKDQDNHKIVAFDLSGEIFRVLPPPPPLSIRHAEEDTEYQLNALGGNLCFIEQVWGRYVDIWTFKNKNHLQQYNENSYDADFDSWSWMKEYIIKWEAIALQFCYYQPFGITDENDILLWYNQCLCCYDTKTNILYVIVDTRPDFFKFQAIPHTNTVVSLKELGVQVNKYKTLD